MHGVSWVENMHAKIEAFTRIKLPHCTLARYQQHHDWLLHQASLVLLYR